MWGFVLTLVSVVIKIIRDRERGELLSAARRKLAQLDERHGPAGDDVAPEDSVYGAQLRAAEQELLELERELPTTGWQAYRLRCEPVSRSRPAAQTASRSDAVAN